MQYSILSFIITGIFLARMFIYTRSAQNLNMIREMWLKSKSFLNKKLARN